jgi:alkanesulfonate monooxygenase
MQIEVGTFLTPRSATKPTSGGELSPVLVDREHVARMSAAAEAADFDFMLTAYNASAHDPFSLAQYSLDHTDRLRQVIAHRPGPIDPTTTARMLSTLDLLSDGRACLHMVTGGFKAELESEGDFLGHDERYARTGEYMQLVKRIWSATEPFDFEGRYYRARGIVQCVRPRQRPYPPLYFGGASEAAKDVGARYADVYMMWGEPLAAVRERVQEMTSLAARYERRLRFNVSFRTVIGRTEAEAGHAVEHLMRQMDEQLVPRYGERVVEMSESVGQRRLYDAARAAEVQDARLFMGFARLVGAQGNSSTLVGTVDQIVESLMAYVRLGVTSFVLRGWGDDEENPELAPDLVRALRRAVTLEAQGALLGRPAMSPA